MEIPIQMDPVPNTEPSVAARTGARIERILCPVDFSECSSSAYEYAQSIARHYRATLLVQHVAELWQHPSASFAISAQSWEDFRGKLLSDGGNDLQQFVNGAGGIEPERIIGEGLAADEILSLARERAVSLIVMGTHGRRGVDHLMLGSVTERVLRKAACPVLAVRQAAPDSSKRRTKDDSVRIRRILCCVDFSAHSERALEYALSLADAYSAEVTVLHVLDDTSGSAEVERETANAIGDLEKLIPSAARSATKVQWAVRRGKAYVEILKFASAAQSDLIVTGVRGRHALDLAVFGSTTYRTIQLGRSPVLTVPI
jgi:nucleotide-binding universal stress UspA family protein